MARAPGVVIRKLRASDISTLVRMVQGCEEVEDYPGEYSVSAFRTMLRGDTHCLVAVRGVPVGFVEFSMEWNRTFVWALFVHPKERGKGVASRLISEVVVQSKRAKCRRLSFLVRDWNKPMQNFARKLKFRETAKLVLFDKVLK